jgi:murein DD-endopeptidase
MAASGSPFTPLRGHAAIDWVRVDEQGRIASGDGNRVANHYGYGQPVLAVCDGRIVATRDSISEPATLDTAAAQHSLDEAAGNYVVLQLPDERFAIYEHLRPGSLIVREGDRVRTGQTLAQVGFTGSSTGPHLHLHVSENPLPLKGEGTAYHLDRFELLGHYTDIGQLGKARWQERTRELTASRRREHPAPNAVLLF